ncbi:hypothetical protein ACFQL7_01475 [Halocatena marina]|uniref:Uncharacterized protein n=1 Tax=Halocatena marina TaxID=2934937 RepID=A0ABD5YID1_9EURY
MKLLDHVRGRSHASPPNHISVNAVTTDLLTNGKYARSVGDTQSNEPIGTLGSIPMNTHPSTSNSVACRVKKTLSSKRKQCPIPAYAPYSRQAGVYYHQPVPTATTSH